MKNFRRITAVVLAALLALKFCVEIRIFRQTVRVQI